MEEINGKTFTDMKIHFKSSNKIAVVKYGHFLKILESWNQNGLYKVTDSDGVVQGAIDIADILFIEPNSDSE